MKPILSILVPTFNRACYLERLLSEVEIQLNDCHIQGDVEVLVADNASGDLTSQVLDKFSRRNATWKTFKNSTNIGADANMLKLLAESHGSYRWIIGDDDLPAPGVLSYILNLITSLAPSLIYLPSAWHPDISTIKLDPVSKYNYQSLSSLKAAEDLHIWITFISSWVFSADQLFSGLSTMELIAAAQGTYFIQLGWILPLMNCPQSTILTARTPAILATSGNTGGYAILRVFIVNYPSLVCKYTSSFTRIRLALIGKALRSYMPRLIVSVRLGKAYRNWSDTAGIFSDSLKFLWYYPSFWLLCLPALFIPVKLIQFIHSLLSVSKQNVQKYRKLA
jgi:glycosyltransferase involved in cell wall biosynthesis